MPKVTSTLRPLWLNHMQSQRFHRISRIATTSMLLVVFCNTVAGQRAEPLSEKSAKSVFDRSSPAVVVVKTDKGSGSGFLINSEGLILTAAHVIEGALSVAVVTGADDRYDQVTLIGIDEGKDFALLKIPGFDLPSLGLGNSNDLSPGDKLFVIGNPLPIPENDRFKNTITDGIFSGLRDLGDGFKVLQMSAPISSGMSGGPVLNEANVVVGIVSFTLVKGQALNFAIPINYARGVINDSSRTQVIKTFGKLDPNTPIARSPANMSGIWKARKDGQVLQINHTSSYVSIVNLTYPEVITEPFAIGEYIVGKVRGQLFKNWYVIEMNSENQLSFYFLKWKPKESTDEKLRRIKERLKKKPDTTLYRLQ